MPRDFVLPMGWLELAVEDRALAELAFDWEELPIRVAPLPLQRIFPGTRAFPAAPAVAPPTPAGVPGNRRRQRPLVGGARPARTARHTSGRSAPSYAGAATSIRSCSHSPTGSRCGRFAVGILSPRTPPTATR